MNNMQILCMDAAGETGEPIFRTPCSVGSGEVVSQFDAAVAAELPLVSTVEYNRYEICKWFAENVRERLAAIAAATEGAEE